MLTEQYYKHYTSESIVKWGSILHGIGYSFLVTSALSFLAIVHARANGLGDATSKDYQKPWVLRILHLVNLAALVLLITGYSKSGDVFSTTNSDAELNGEAHAGDLIYCGITLILFGYTFLLFPKTTRGDKRVLGCVSVALVFMAIRCGYSTWHTYQTPFLGVNLWLKLVLDYVAEALAVLAFIPITFVNHENDYLEQKQYEVNQYASNYAAA